MTTYPLVNNTSIIAILWGLGFFAKIIILTLIIFSIISWAIIIKKYFLFKKIKKSNDFLYRYFQERRSIFEFANMANEYPKNLLSKLIIVALNEWQKLNIENKANSQLNSDEKTHKLLQLLPNISETLQRTASQELEKMEQNVSFLATTGSVSPFLGLLGTVWGILSAFLSVRHIPVVTLQVIAPGISDALVTTVVGLLVAIPAVIAYNYFIGKIKNISDEIDRWSLEIIGDIRKKIVEE